MSDKYTGSTVFIFLRVTADLCVRYENLNDISLFSAHYPKLKFAYYFRKIFHTYLKEFSFAFILRLYLTHVEQGYC